MRRAKPLIINAHFAHHLLSIWKITDKSCTLVCHQLDTKAFQFAINMPQSKIDICADTLHCLQPNVTV